MKAFVTLLVREWREWRTVFLIVGIVYALGLIGYTVLLHKGSEAIMEGRVTTQWTDEDRWNREDDADDEGWFSPEEFASVSKSELIYVGWTHWLRVGVSGMSLALVILAVFYLVDVVYKERADGSTFFYRGLPVGDLTLLSSKLTAGSVGFLAASFILGVVWVWWAQITFPGSLADALAEAGISPYQIRTMDFIGDWFIFHVLALVWLLPYVAYFLLVSTATRSRPLLVAIGIPLLLGLFWRLLVGDNALLREITENFRLVGIAVTDEWTGMKGHMLGPDKSSELFGSFSSYVLSLRTLVSLAISGGLFGLTFYAYRRNMPVS
jgi:hypothetical protein